MRNLVRKEENHKFGFTLPPVQSKIALLLRFTSQQRRLGTVSALRLCKNANPLSPHTPYGRLAFAKCKALSSSFAFTLAEVLITLAIIGVVAALTIPSIVRNYQETQRKSAVKKEYSTLVRITNLVMQENGGDMITTPPSTDYGTISSYYMDMYKKYMPHTKECAVIDTCVSNGIWHNNSDWFSSNGEPISSESGGYYFYSALIANDGTLWRFYFYRSNCDYNNTDVCGVIHFDINGFKKPNTMGKDIFGFTVEKNGRVSTNGLSNIVK